MTRVEAADARCWQAAGEVHRLRARLRWAACRTPARKARFLLRRALLPAIAVKHAIEGTRAYGAGVAHVAGVPRLRQFLHQCAIGLRYDYDADAYYRYRLYRLPDVRSAGLFLTLEANMALRGHLYRRLRLDEAPLADKRNFYRTCLAAGLPAPRTLADFEAGEVRWWPGATAGSLPQRDLFSKEACNYKGAGAARWLWQRDDRWCDEAGVALSGAQVLERLAHASHAAPQLLQERLANHAAIARIAPQTLCTVRVVTYRDLRGDLRHLASTFRMAGGPYPADNFSRRGLASRVDEATGALWPAVYKDLHDTAVDHAVHPVYGTPIAGFVLPHWRDVLDVALAAHRAHAQFPSIGWDIAITPQGPVIVEGNYNWNVVLTQQAGSCPLGATDFFASYLAQLR